VPQTCPTTQQAHTGRTPGILHATPDKTRTWLPHRAHAIDVLAPVQSLPEVARIDSPIFQVVKELRFQIKRSLNSQHLISIAIETMYLKKQDI